MSVWTSDTHKVAVCKRLFEIDPSLLDRILGPTIAPYLDPDPGTSGLWPDDKWDDMAMRCGWESAYAWTDVIENLDDEFDFNAFPKAIVGTPAVYRLVRAIYTGQFECQSVHPRTFVEDATIQTIAFVEPSTQATPKSLVKAARQYDMPMMKLAHKFEDAAEGFKYARLGFERTAKQIVKLNMKRFFGPGYRAYHGFTINNLVFLFGAAKAKTHMLIMARENWDQVIGACMRISNTLNFWARSYEGNMDAIAAMHKMVDLTIHKAALASPSRSYWVARAFHKARSIDFLDVVQHVYGTGELEADYRKENLQHILPLNVYFDAVRRCNTEVRLALALVYKWMPSPDFDATNALGVMKKYHTNPRSCGFDTSASIEQKNVAENVMIERKLNLIHTYRRMNNEWPPGITPRGDNVTRADAAAWDHTACILYVPYGKDITSTVKDKACAPAYSDDYLRPHRKSYDESYLLWYMRHKTEIDTRELLKDYDDAGIGEERYVGVAYKPESHKVDSRLFYIAPPKQRVLLSEMESNLSRIAGYYPGSLMGVEATKKRMIIDKLMNTYREAPGASPDELYTVYTITLDLTKFSAQASYTMTENYTTFWSEVFGVPDLAKLATIGCKGDICHSKFGLSMRYRNAGADLEGFRGRMMTMLHVDVLAAATRRARNEKIICGQAILGAFIDDGGFKVNVIGEGAVAEANVRKLLTILAETYAAVGQKMEPSKATVSTIGGDLLSEPYLHGVRIPTPIKSAQRLYPDYENLASAITEEFDSLFASAQGMVKEGAKWAVAYTMYVEAVIKSLSRWGRRDLCKLSIETLALKMITPKSFGGFGLQPMAGLVSTNTSNLTQEGMGMLNRVSRQVPGMRVHVKRVLKKPLVARSPLQRLRDPMRIRANVPVLVENRLLMRVLDWLNTSGGELTDFCEGLTAGSAVEHATRLAEKVLSGSSVSVPMLLHVWRATPLSYIESILGKFKRSATIITLLGEREVSKVRRANKTDLITVLKESN